MHWRKITLAGVGLLGGSLGLAIKQRRLADRVDGLVRRMASVSECTRLGVVDHATRHPARSVEGADLVILCTPIARMREMVELMRPGLDPGTVVTDVGSVKGAVVHDLEPLVSSAGAHFVGSHPLAGTEKSGVLAARPDMFDQAWCVLTPTPRTSADALERVDGFWRALGGRTLHLSPEDHDELVGRSSHLPHIVAAELANYVLSPLHPPEQALLCASGFRDTTRIASGSPEMWRDIALANRKNLMRVLRVFIEDLEEFRHALESGDARAVADFFEKAKQRRDQWCEQGRSPE
ncbi:MAG: prephenate dehydrogenase/arogenate dehydrogenase family protein [Verrucomicrobia bacterium]|nr:prephenate dehydrogenase/arogenate dehydrogenase family protein [Verrucomicrobiota bacterium]